MEYVLEQGREAGPLEAKRMFGEYALYLGGKVVALVCDNQVFVKPTEPGRALLAPVEEGRPYPGAKPHLEVTELVERPAAFAALLRATAAALPEPKPRKPRRRT